MKLESKKYNFKNKLIINLGRRKQITIIFEMFRSYHYSNIYLIYRFFEMLKFFSERREFDNSCYLHTLCYCNYSHNNCTLLQDLHNARMIIVFSRISRKTSAKDVRNSAGSPTFHGHSCLRRCPA